MSLTDLAAIVKTKKAEIAAVLKETGEREIKASVGDLFAKFPALTSVRWRQYTPYFNDGDPCEFSVHEVEALLVGANPGEDDEGEWLDLWSFSYEKKDKEHPELLAALKEFNGALMKIGDGMEDLFGDHKQIVCTREGIAIDEYDHD